ncbi:MAG: hypothetical protein Q9171_005127 [Xanthocarpia ochracea]
MSEDVLPGMRTVYHWPSFTVKVFDELWSAGFTDVDVPDEYNRTPLAMIGSLGSYGRTGLCQLIESAFWLCQRGASLHHPCCPTLPPGLKNVGITAAHSERRTIHFITAAVKDGFRHAAPSRSHFFPAADGSVAQIEHLLDDLDLKCQHFLYDMLLDNSPDDCLCACSGHGCMPMSYFLKCRGTSPWRVADPVVSPLLRRWFFANVPIDHHPTVSFQAILRLATFEDLGLRHTCCVFTDGEFSTIEPEEIAEIREEDHQGIQLLELLLLEFEEKRGDEYIKSFIDGYWSTRMAEIHTTRDKESVDKTAIREVGVILDDDDYDE